MTLTIFFESSSKICGIFGQDVGFFLGCMWRAWDMKPPGLQAEVEFAGETQQQNTSTHSSDVLQFREIFQELN